MLALLLYYVEEGANVFKEGLFRMPTLEERLEVLERALAAMRLEQISDVRQLDERISALHQQLAEQRKHLAERDQAISQLGQTIDAKFDGLMQVLAQQANTVNARFDSIDTRFDAIDQKFIAVDTRFTRLEERIDRQTVEITAKFETSDLYATRTWGVVQAQEQDMRTVKERLDQIVNLLTDKPEG
jgi:chromosome segregation ATPase